MRLLNSKNLTMHEFFDSNIPPYAILSHTWESGEISFQEMIKPLFVTRSQPGYQKVQRCCEVASSDGFNYVWVDTCCIDKTSSAELSEAINSMYHWYRQARVCYVILHDVPSGQDPKLLNSHFRRSRWFTRGWTLQELIASPTAIFYDRNWKEIGTKTTLRHLISEVTSIHAEVLSGEHGIEMYSIAQRMSWASRRQTTRREDIAYCLMGIFNVNMPLLYGEGDKAFFRLQEQILNSSEDDSILAHVSLQNQTLDNFNSSFLATSPIGFSGCQNIVWSAMDRPLVGHSVSCRGLMMELDFVGHNDGRTMWAVLKCRRISKFDNSDSRVVLHCTEVGYDGQRGQLIKMLSHELQTLYEVCTIDEWAFQVTKLQKRGRYLSIAPSYRAEQDGTVFSTITVTTRGWKEKGYVLQDQTNEHNQDGIIYCPSPENYLVGLRFSGPDRSIFDVWIQLNHPYGCSSRGTVAIERANHVYLKDRQTDLNHVENRFMWESVDFMSCPGAEEDRATVKIRPCGIKTKPGVKEFVSNAFKVEIEYQERDDNHVYEYRSLVELERQNSLPQSKAIFSNSQLLPTGSRPSPFPRD